MIRVLSPLLQPFLSGRAGSHRPDPAVAPRRGLACGSPRPPRAPARRKTKASCVCAPRPPRVLPECRRCSARAGEGKSTEFLSCFSSRRPLRPSRQLPPSLWPASPGTEQPAPGRARGRAAAQPRTSAPGHRRWMWKAQTLEPQVGDAGGVVDGAWFASPSKGLRPAVWGSESHSPTGEVTPMAPQYLRVISGAVSQAMGAGESRGVGLAVPGSWGGPWGWAGLCRGSWDSAAPSVRSGSIFGRGITRASRLLPPWTGLFASPSRRVRRAVLCCAVPRQAALICRCRFLALGWGEPGTARCSGQGAGVGRELVWAGSRCGQGNGTGRGMVQAAPPLPGKGGVCDLPKYPGKGTSRRCGGPCWPSISAVGIWPCFGTLQGTVSPRGGQEAFASCSQPSRQRRGGKLGAVAWNGLAGVSSGFITLPVAAGQR